jgi:Domain of unknown function (DUF4430)
VPRSRRRWYRWRAYRWRASAVAAPLAVLLAAALAGCGLGAGRAPGGVQLLVTRDFGARVLGSWSAPSLHGELTVMSLLERNAAVGTRYGGGFVQSVDGVSGGHERGASVDWFYYVNGVEAPAGAAATNVHAGDHVWWDRHDWSQTDHIPAVVGSFPEPFLHGIEGKRLPVRVQCASVRGGACQAVLSTLRAAGVPAAVAALGGGGPDTLSVIVGPWSLIGRGEAARAISGGPAASGVYATFSADGRSLALLDEDGARRATLTGSAGLIAATRVGEEAPTWLVTGIDEAGLALASRAFDAQALDGRFAVAVTSAGTQALPVVSG